MSSNFNIQARFAAVGQQQVLADIQSMQTGMTNLTRQAQANASSMSGLTTALNTVGSSAAASSSSVQRYSTTLTSTGQAATSGLANLNQFIGGLNNSNTDTGEKSGENRLPAEFGSWRVELG